MTTKEGNTHLRKSVGLSENIKRTWQQNKFLENAALMGNLAKSKKKQTKKARKYKSGLQPKFSDIEREILEKITAKQKTQSPKTSKKSSSPRWGMKEKQAEFRRYGEKRLTDKLHNLAASIGWLIPENMSFPKKLELYKLLRDNDKPIDFDGEMSSNVIYNLPEYSPTSDFPVDTNFTTYDNKLGLHIRGSVGKKSKKRKKKKRNKSKKSKRKRSKTRKHKRGKK